MAFSCPKCGVEFYDRLKYCPDCGCDFTSALKKCPRCRSQILHDLKDCPECHFDFEKWAFLLPKIIVLSALALLIISAIVGPLIWKNTPWLHDTATIQEGYLVSEVGGQALVPLFINWKTGERYIEVAKEHRGGVSDTEYMNNLVPLPPSVVFHYEMQLGEKVWIIQRVKGSGTNEWARIGRWMAWGKPYKFGWVHATNLKVDK
jgi:hypothetical protein